MNKETILEKSRREYKNKDMAELNVINRASRAAMIVGVILCMIISALDWHFKKTINCGCWMVDFGILSTLFILKYIKLKRKHELIIGIIYALIFAFFCYGYIFGLTVTI